MRDRIYRLYGLCPHLPSQAQQWVRAKLPRSTKNYLSSATEKSSTPLQTREEKKWKTLVKNLKEHHPPGKEENAFACLEKFLFESSTPSPPLVLWTVSILKKIFNRLNSDEKLKIDFVKKKRPGNVQNEYKK